MERPPAIYYFTGTGNSLAVAREIAQRLGGHLIPIVRALEQPQIHPQSGVIGLVFPIYDFKAPPLVIDLIHRLQDSRDKYWFAVSTYGFTPGRALLRLQQAVHDQGAELAGAFALGMPHNGIGCAATSQVRRTKLLRTAKERVGEICDFVLGEQSGHIEAKTSVGAFLRPEMLRVLPALARFAKTMIVGGTQALAFQSGDACIGCATCSRICPVENIEMVEGNPRWHDRCVNCFACLHWCPTNAISLGGLDLGIAQYHHPSITLEDVVAKKC